MEKEYRLENYIPQSPTSHIHITETISRFRLYLAANDKSDNTLDK